MNVGHCFWNFWCSERTWDSIFFLRWTTKKI